MRAEPSRAVRPIVRKPKEFGTLAEVLADAGVSPTALFGWKRTAFRRIEAVSATHVALDFDRKAIAIPRALLPTAQVDQWVRFERRGASVTASVDLRATLKAEARLSDLFQALSR